VLRQQTNGEEEKMEAKTTAAHRGTPRTADEERGVEEFKQFLRIRTVSQEGHKGANWEAVRYLQGLLEPMGLSTKTVECIQGKVRSVPLLLCPSPIPQSHAVRPCCVTQQPVLIATLLGEEPSLPSLLLNSHYDVVPAVDAQWKVVCRPPPTHPR
jgi:aminoacylase